MYWAFSVQIVICTVSLVTDHKACEGGNRKNYSRYWWWCQWCWHDSGGWHWSWYQWCWRATGMDLFFSLVETVFEHGFFWVSVVCQILFVVGRLTLLTSWMEVLPLWHCQWSSVWRNWVCAGSDGQWLFNCTVSVSGAIACCPWALVL